MPLCACDCECDWCILGHMAQHCQFKEKLDQLVYQFKATPEFRAIQERNKRLVIAYMNDSLN